MPRAALLVALLVAAAFLGVPAGGNHLQNDTGKAIVFDHRTGNEWWVEVVLSGQGSGTVMTLEGQDTGGPWVKMEKKSWGAYAASFHIEPGHDVRFRASWSGGAQQLSCWFSHPAGAEKCSTTPPPPPPPPPPAPTGYNPTLSGIQGNEWWIQVSVKSDRALAGVDARVDGGTWVPLKLQSWGGWAVSTHVVSGAEVQFRVRATDGALYFPSNGWTWPNAAPFPAERGVFEALFLNVKGNTGWVQANVYTPASQPAAKVEARVDGGAWRNLARQSYGDFAAAIAAPDGSFVQFRACNSQAVCSQSSPYRWPSAQPTTWPTPVESSATYHATGGSGSPGGDYWVSYDVMVELRYTRDGWRGTCRGTEHTYSQYNTPQDTYAAIDEPVSYAPPSWPAAVAVGQNVTGNVIVRCALQSMDTQVIGEGSYATKVIGQPTTVRTWQADYEPCPCADYNADWARHQGLLLKWGHGGLGGGYGGNLVDTDAPIA
ncbi:MAG: endoglucanase [Thermoplasmata archaeon]|jgi:hypothetical protein|nr:endoglucanase [Thermoplasmata archaeon]